MNNEVVSGRPMTVGQLLSGDRSHLFDMTRNIRRYCWDPERDVLPLLESLESASLNNLLHLGCVHISPTEDKHLTPELKTIVDRRTCSMYDVHDGQQRIITLVLVLCAIRDSIKTCQIQLEDDLKRMVQPSCENAVAPPGSRRGEPSVPRVVCDNSFLEEIQMARASDVDADNEPPAKRQRKENHGASALKAAYEYILDYVAVAKSNAPVSKEKVRQRIERLYTLEENVRLNTNLLVCFHCDARVAKYFVLGQRHGKSIEAVDYCRQFLCSNDLDKEPEADREVTKSRFDKVCDEFGRRFVEEACIMVGQFRTGILLHHEVDGSNLFEKFAKQEIPHKGGSRLYDEIVYPAVQKLQQLRKLDQLSSIGFGANDKEQAQLATSLRFLHEMVTTQLGKEMEILVVAVLVLFQRAPASLCEQLLLLEQIALWWALGKPNKAQRRGKLRLVLSTLKEDGGLALSLLSPSEKEGIRNQLARGDFSDGRDAQKRVKAILERVNLASLHKQEGRGHFFVNEKVRLERLPIESAAVQSKWGARLGAHVVTNGGAKKTENFTKKKERLSCSVFPLTATVGDRMCGQSIKDIVKQNHAAIISAAIAHWHLS